MNEQSMEKWEARLSQLAAEFAYPEAPSLTDVIVQRVQGAGWVPGVRPLRRLAWALVLLCLLVGGLLAVPPVRAAVLEFLQIGAVRIFLPAPIPTPEATLTVAEERQPAGGDAARLDAPSQFRLTPAPQYLVGKTTLADAQAQLDFPIRLPTYPTELGEPDHVYLQNANGPLLVLIWLHPEVAADGGTVELRQSNEGDYLAANTGDQSPQVRLALYQLGPGVFASKGQTAVVTETLVNGGKSAWVEGFHVLQVGGGTYRLVRLVENQVLVWTREENGQTITYRLETDLSMQEAVRIAESLQ